MARYWCDYVVLMATIPPFFADCVVAIGNMHGAEVRPSASGFLYGHLVTDDPDPAKKAYRIFLLTNKHVVEKVQQIYLRFNPKSQQPAKWLPVPLLDQTNSTPIWCASSHPEADVVVLPINPHALNVEGIHWAFFGSDLHVADRDRMVALGVEEGDFVFVLGFPMGLAGTERNYVITRHGSIARLRDAIADRNISEFLIDSIVLPGNSGGPVVSRPEAFAIAGTKSVNAAYLIGVAAGYVPYQEVAVSQQTQRPRVIFEENSGLALVVPIDYVSDAITQFLKREELKAASNPPVVAQSPTPGPPAP